MARISVIVPVYNVQDYLEDSFSSLLAQSFTDFEIIAIDDGSLDGSREMLERLAEKDGRIRVVAQENAGPSAARNKGMQEAQGSIICFMDADDRFHSDALETIARFFDDAAAEDPPLDILTFGADCFPREDATVWHEVVLHPRNAHYLGFEPDLVFKEATRPFHWRCAFRAAFLKDDRILFDDNLRLGEDQAFLFAAYLRAKRVILSDEILYDYRVSRADSAMGQTLLDPAEMMRKHLDIARAIYEDWRLEGALQRYAEPMAAWLVEFMIYDTLTLDDAARGELLEQARSLLQSYWSADEIAEMDIPRATKDILLATIDETDMSMRTAKKLRKDYYLQQYGAVSAIKSVLRRLRHKG